jgi:chromodomain-helicase-DNA-binding protein 4
LLLKLKILQISFADLLLYNNGQEALNNFEIATSPDPITERKAAAKPRRSSGRMSSTRPRARAARRDGFVNTADVVELSDPELASEDELAGTRRSGRVVRQQDYTPTPELPTTDDDEDEGDDDSVQATAKRTRGRPKKGTTAASRKSLRASHRAPALDDSDRDILAASSDEEQDEDDDDNFLLKSDVVASRKRSRKSRSSNGESRPIKRQREGERQSGRSNKHNSSMKEVDIDNIYRSDSSVVAAPPPKAKIVHAKEVFKPLPRNDEFRMRHSQHCEVCSDGINSSPLIYCQGCTFAYHKSCIGHRGSRDHLVTKVGEDDYVLQCRRCIALVRKKEPTAPDQGKCQDCTHHGAGCQPFRSRRTTSQEQREREENDGVDPIHEVNPELVNNADNVLFRCIKCFRGFHFEHLPSRTDMMEMDSEADAEQRFREYSRDWECKDCLQHPTKVAGLIAWKPTDEDNYDDSMTCDEVEEDEKAYLLRWENQSYFKACWMPGAWVWGITSASMRKAFARREEAQRPKMRTEEAIPEDFLRTDIVLDIKFTSIVDVRTEDIDKARIREVDQALIKYKGLGYEDAVWEKPPDPEDGDRWTDFVTAYNDWVLGRYVRPASFKTLKSRHDRTRKQDFSSLEQTTQPDSVQGGKLMTYQLEGLNWLYYKWFSQKNAILADEMGLGKTIQIIGFLATLVQDHNTFPFLVVVPNSTCPNWRREIKRWAPSLRVVAFYGSKESRDLAYKHEMFPENAKDLRCHVVVTSYDAAADDSCRKFFRSIHWQGMIVDEGQRLKNEKSLLYAALGALKAPFKVLMTGTPLQNNQRELFNLLHFLDDSHNPDDLEKEYEDLDQAKIIKLHDLIRPYFLRRTKAQVLTFLPPMAQIILPVSMSVLQKKVYRTILAKNPELLRSIFNPDQTLGKGERASLSNVLMQLRKCLCHPFVYNRGIEERHDNNSLSHRSLVDASSKLKLLEVLLPKLQERGHRVLIFSQFLDMLDMVEDFLDGMAMQYQRLDGQISSLQKQKRIDEFNDPASPLFAFLLSTRAGGVGINLATADTVIILDPDFNPHQDIQALSRAHRIGQTKKVLCFQLVTRASAEEKIMQIGRRKLALDHVLIQEMDTDDADEQDLASVLRHGASELFEDDGEHDIVYDNTSVEHLLDRSRVEDTNAVGDKSAETQFSNARVWANNTGGLEDLALDQSEDTAPDPGVWANILKERERVANEEAAAKAEALGRGRRARGNIDYGADKLPDAAEGLDLDVDTLTPLKKRRRKSKNPDETDTDFQADSDAESGAEDGENGRDGMLDNEDVNLAKQNLAPKKPGKQTSSLKTPPKTAPATPVKKGKTGVKGGTSSVTNGIKTSPPSSKKTVATKEPAPKPAAKPLAIPAKKRATKKDETKPAVKINSITKTAKASAAQSQKKALAKKKADASIPSGKKLSEAIVLDTPEPEPEPAQNTTAPNSTNSQ